MAHSEPYLSVVVTSRNDDHGQTLLRRMQTFVNALIGQCKRHGLQAELILVEWNPPADRPRFIEALRWPEATDPCQVRIIEVPPELHRRFRHADNLPLFQMIAKNVGIRRARGRFVVATNIDILLSDELVGTLARGELRRGRMYRIDRYDVMTDVPVFADVDEQLRYCETHLLRINCREGTFELTPDGRRTVAVEDIATADMGVSFEKGWYPVERWHGEVYRWVGQDAILAVPVPSGPAQALCLEVEPGPGVRNGPFELQVRDTREQIVARGMVECRQLIYLTMPLRAAQTERLHLHTVGGGRPISFDPRILNFRVMKCCWAEAPPAVALEESSPEVFHFRAEDVSVLAKEDIATPESGLRFGRGWHGFERWDDEGFRWVGNDASLAITLPSASAPILSLEVEPGPGVENRPFGLQVQDTVGRTVARGFIQGRQVVYLTLPLQTGQTHYFRLHTEGGGRPIANSPRILNFRVLRCTWVDQSQIPASEPEPAGTFHCLSGDAFQLAKEDIAPADMGLRFGRGWYPVERNQGILSRWVGEDANIVVQTPAWMGEGSCPVLSMELQPGPGVDSQIFTLRVEDQAGQTVAQGVVGGLEIVHLLLPLRPGQTEQFRLRVPDGGRRIASDPRILNFNVLRCFWSIDWAKISKSAFAQPDDAYNFKAEEIYLLADADIAPADMGLRFGRGWYPVECNDGLLSCWVSQDAGIAVEAPPWPGAVLSMELQPGPGVGHEAFTLQVQNRAGQTVAQGVIGGREIVHILLPVRPGQTEQFRLHIPNGGRRIPSDPRILNFNVFRCFWSKNWEEPEPRGVLPERYPALGALPQPADAHHLKTEDVYMLAEVDIASPEMGLRFGRGWYPVEQTNGVPYRWAGQDAALAVEGRQGKAWVLSMEVQPGPGVGYQPFVLQVIDRSGRTVAQGIVDGRKIVHLLLPLPAAQGARFCLRAVGGGKRITADTRILNFHISRCHWSQDWEVIPLLNQPADSFNFKTEDPYELAEKDIASPDMGLRFGQGWYPVECNNGLIYRWVGDHAGLAVDVEARLKRAPHEAPVLSLDVQPGPGVDYRPFTLRVLDANGRTVAQGNVAGRRVVHLLLPFSGRRTDQFRLHAVEGGRRITTDPRILNFGVFRCYWSNDWEALTDPSQPADAFNLKTEDPYVVAPEDIAPADEGLRFGPGWHAVERNQGILSRWVGDHAGLEVDVPWGPARALCLEVAPGPGVEHRPFHLQVHDANGQRVARVRVGGREVINLRLPVRSGRTERFWFQTEGGGRRTAHDPRIMNFAAFHCFWSQEGKSFTAEDAEERRGKALLSLPPRSSASSAVSSFIGWSKKANGQAEGTSLSRKVGFRVEDASVLAEHDIASTVKGLRFGTGWSALEQNNGAYYRWVEEGAQFTIQEMTDTPVKILSLDLERAPELPKRPLQLQIHDPDGRILAEESIEGGRQVARWMLRVRPGQVERFRFHLESGGDPDLGELNGPIARIFRCRWSPAGFSNPETHESDVISPLPLHTCACGDFTLMAREDWFELLGYPEFEMFSLHIDGVFCYLAHHHGVVEAMLEEPMRIYHIEHGTGSGWTPEGATKLMERIAAKGIPCLECPEVLAWATEMRRLNRLLVLNYQNWGMPDDILPETIVGEQMTR
jgi:hypothetical protein